MLEAEMGKRLTDVTEFKWYEGIGGSYDLSE